MSRSEQFYTLFEQIHQQSLRAMLHGLEGKITRTQLGALYQISLIEPCNAKDVADKLGIKPSSATVLLERLDELGWIERKNDEKDRRAIWIHLRVEGKEILTHASELRQKTIGELLQKLPEEKQLQLIQTFQILTSEE